MKVYKIPESVLVVIHTADLDVLLIERADKAGFWQSVTGAKDTAEESLFETAVREVAEETGIRVLPENSLTLNRTMCHCTTCRTGISPIPTKFILSGATAMLRA